MPRTSCSCHRGDDLLAEFRVRLDQLPLLAVSGPGFSSTESGMPILPMSWKSAPSSSRFSVSVSSPSCSPTRSAVWVIQRACDEVYSSRALSASASASTVQRNVRSRPGEAGGVRDRELRLVGETASELELAVAESAPARRGRRSHPAALERERGDDVRARPPAGGSLSAAYPRGRPVGLGALRKGFDRSPPRSEDRRPCGRPRSRLRPARRGRRRPPGARAKRVARRSAGGALDDAREHSSSPSAAASSRPNSSSALALSASRRCAS